MLTLIQPVMLRYHPAKPDLAAREVVLFIPDMEAWQDNIACYIHIGQHGEACMAYFRECLPMNAAPRHMQQQGADLLTEYRAICEVHKMKMKIVKRDTPKFQRARWGWTDDARVKL